MIQITTRNLVKSILVAFIFIGIFSISNAQKIKIKKNRIYADKKEVGFVSKEGTTANNKSIWGFTDLSKENTLRVICFSNIQYKLHWLEITPSFGDSKTIEVKREYVSPFSAKKDIVRQLYKMEFFTMGGVNKENVEKYLIEHEGDETYTQRIARLGEEARQKQLAMIKQEKHANAINPWVNRKGKIIKGGHEGTEVIGEVKSPDHWKGTLIQKISVYDENGKLIAKGKTKGLESESKAFVFTTFDGEKHKFTIKYELNAILKPVALGDICRQLMIRGYLYEGPKQYNSEKDIWKKK